MSFFLSFFCHLRSPSPEPIYNSEGKRLNTREYRTRKKIEEERHSLITEMVGLNPDFKPPADYKYALFICCSLTICFKIFWLQIHFVLICPKRANEKIEEDFTAPCRKKKKRWKHKQYQKSFKSSDSGTVQVTGW